MVSGSHSMSLPFIFDVDVLWHSDDSSSEAKTARNIGKDIYALASRGVVSGGQYFLLQVISLSMVRSRSANELFVGDCSLLPRLAYMVSNFT